MEDKAQAQAQDDDVVPNEVSTQKHGTEKNSSSSTTAEPVRSRWTPKPEQILILESIFNSGMVNPPKDETVRIRKLLEKFGTVGDANVFYWFQNRRSRSRRRQRQMQQAAAASSASLDHQRNNQIMVQQQQQPVLVTTMGFGSSLIKNDSSSAGSSSGGVFSNGQQLQGLDHALFSSVTSDQMAFPAGIDDHTLAAPNSSILCSPLAPNLSYHSGVGGGGYGGGIDSTITGLITVFINGIATEVEAGVIDMKTVFGEDVMLVHSSGVPVPTNEYGFLMQTLQHGESYFLVSKSTQV